MTTSRRTPLGTTMTSTAIQSSAGTIQDTSDRSALSIPASDASIGLPQAECVRVVQGPLHMTRVAAAQTARDGGPGQTYCHEDPQTLVEQQRCLRDRLLGYRHFNGGTDMRELAAEMLLYLDDPGACWHVLTEWLLKRTRAQRIDVGFGSSTDRVYRPALERMRVGCHMRSVLGISMNARDSAIAIVWSSRAAVEFSDITHDSRLCAETRASLLTAGTRSKLAVALRDGSREVGLLCCDTSGDAGAWTPLESVTIDALARDFVGPIMAGLLRLHPVLDGSSDAGFAEQGRRSGSLLTPAELRVAELVMDGLSYKAIARRLGRSPATIDHQLRSMRRKFGVNSNSTLMHELLTAPRSSLGGHRL